MPVSSILGLAGRTSVLCLIIFFLLFRVQAEDCIPWKLPTGNTALWENHPEKFYQPTISRRLISGRFGFVRTSGPEPARMFEHFHKGIDIRPETRTGTGEPTDPVRACADGEVVRVNDDARISDYGKQVIVRHDWGGLPVYTIYGHLASTSVQVGQNVKAGSQVGVLGWSGSGLSRDRAHLHLEVAFELNKKFDEWIREAKPGRFWEPNRHGEWNGLNFMGVDPVPLLKAAH
ncbi:MAG: M23 family metallopeptidase [Verrucomicrobia bacterium]|nr:M23 family metallopeptidase [Verrucomicrobiota bacterium]